jgi:phage-related tail protein
MAKGSIKVLSYGLTYLYHRKLNVKNASITIRRRQVRTTNFVEGLRMSDDDTYVRAKLTEINGAIERLTQMLNRMIDVLSKITEVQDSNSEISLAVAANSEKLDELMVKIENVSASGLGRPADATTLEQRGAVSSLSGVLDTLDSQIREGVIASDLSIKIAQAASTLEQKGGVGQLVVKMQRWVRILKTYGRVDPINPSDVQKLRKDLKDWQKEVSQAR